jgi:probable rRNA maturation factor
MHSTFISPGDSLGEPDSAHPRKARPSVEREIVERARLIRRQRTVPADWEEIRRFLNRVPSRLAPSPYSVCVLSDRGIRRYNKRFRRRDEATDVLSFPAGRAGRRKKARNEYLGDILISAETARVNARRYGIRLEDEIKTLVLHALLHLLGHDHERDNGEMARREKQWAARLGLQRPVIGRVRPAREKRSAASSIGE